MQRTLLLTLLTALVLAGCAGNSPSSTPTPKGISSADAQALVKTAATDMPDVFAMDATITSGSKELLTLAGVFDNATGTTYLDIKGDLKSLSPRTAGQSGMGDLLGDAIALYMTKDRGMVYYVNGTAFAFSAKGTGSGMVPTPQQAGAGALTDPSQVLGFAQGDINVTSVAATTWQGKPAYEVKLTGMDEGKAVNATVIVLQSPARLVHLEAVLPSDSSNAGDPFAGAMLKADITYEGDLKARIPAKITRALGLVHETDHPGFPGMALQSQNWTFQGGEGIALAEIEARLLDAPAEGSSQMAPPTVRTVLWSLPLSEGTKSGNGVTLTFTDKDADGKLSQGDILRIDVAEDAEGQVALYDTVTKTYVVPSAGVALAALALAGIALVLRRR
jgi:hypothetical protein